MGCQVYLLDARKKPRERSITSFKMDQGRSSSQDASRYPGDRAFRHEIYPTLQIGIYDLTDGDGQTVIPSLPVVGIHLAKLRHIITEQGFE